MALTYQGRHRAVPPPRPSARPSRLAAALAVICAAVALLLGSATLTASPASASVQSPSAMTWGGSHTGNAALNWAEGHEAGHWYGWGGTGPAVYDCSGAVYAAMRATNPRWPSSVRTTYQMIAWLYAHATRVYSPQRGDLAFYGSGHVEIVTAWWHTTFGAQQSGTRVGWHQWSGYWAPTMFFRVW